MRSKLKGCLVNSGIGEAASEAFVRLSGGVRREGVSLCLVYHEGKKIYIIIISDSQRTSSHIPRIDK